MFKSLPGVGSIVGGAGVSVTAGGLTYATGKVFTRHFAAGGTLQDFDMKKHGSIFTRISAGQAVCQTENKHPAIACAFLRAFQIKKPGWAA
ncbi:MAG: hypothetical protein HZT40_07180 [Candidatus Thiothrix singaporensis]|uniref:Uncharacterized protein n=1 Tax=Candidatus Thiothrix singaporensis TaxID=2799669 RepID=A0A7L6AQP6_9GAMM|nr:MAG: hypothetical protein HZT40_07180 [Candidatus Thiothrix singaporensis]